MPPVRVIVVRPLCAPVVEELPDDSLDSFYAVIGEPVDVRRLDAKTDIWFHEEGQLNGMVRNRMVAAGLNIYGPFILAGRLVTDEGAHTVSLTDAQIEHWMTQAATWPMYSPN